MEAARNTVHTEEIPHFVDFKMARLVSLLEVLALAAKWCLCYYMYNVEGGAYFAYTQQIAHVIGFL